METPIKDLEGERFCIYSASIKYLHCARQLMELNRDLLYSRICIQYA